MGVCSGRTSLGAERAPTICITKLISTVKSAITAAFAKKPLKSSLIKNTYGPLTIINGYSTQPNTAVLIMKAGTPVCI